MKRVIHIIYIMLILLPYKTIAIGNSDSNNLEVSGKNYQIYKVNSRVEGLKLALHSYGPAQQQARGTILLIHGSSFPSKLSFGFKMAGKSWVDHLTHAGFQVYMLDFLGYGDSHRYYEMVQKQQSKKALGRGIEAAIDVNLVVEFIFNKDKINNIDILGHSWGGAVAAKFTENHPQKVNSLVMYAGISTVKTDQIKQVEKISAYTRMTPKRRIQSLNFLAPEAKRPLLASELFKGWGDKWLKSDPLSAEDQNVSFPAGPSADIQDFFNGYSFYNPAKIKSNVLIIRGEYDRYPSNEQAYKLFSDMINVREKRYVVISDGTHVLHLEKNRSKLYANVSNFLIEQINNNL